MFQMSALEPRLIRPSHVVRALLRGFCYTGSMMTPSRRQPLIAALLLVAASLACATGDTGESPTLAANLSTVTPGGHVSVSLLTPAPTFEGAAEQIATPIGPVATATAAAATAAAATATALVPTPTIPGVFTSPALCPLPSTSSLPQQPPSFADYAETMVQYLSAGGATTILEARLRAWGAIVDYGGLVLVDRDFTGDGVPEVLVVALDPQRAEFPYPGDLFIFGCQEGAYRLLYQAGYQRNRGAPVVRVAHDINGDFLNDLVYVRPQCETATSCTTEVQAVEWNLTLGNFENLLPEAVSEPSAEVKIEDVDGNGLSEIVITSGVTAAPEAGPQRVYTKTFTWDGTHYVLIGVAASPAQYRIHVIHDADSALRAGDALGAVDLYQQAIIDEGLMSWQYPNEAEHLKAYARFRIMLAYAVQGDVAAAQRARDELIGAYETMPSPADQPGGQFAEMARLFWNDFALNRDVVTACRIVVDYARLRPVSFEVLNSFGTANPTYTPTDLCPFN